MGNGGIMIKYIIVIKNTKGPIKERKNIIFILFNLLIKLSFDESSSSNGDNFSLNK